MSLLPSKPDTSAADDADPRVIGVESEDADEVLAALTSETARRVLSELHDQPAPPAELAERVGTSLQNAQYHLGKLEDAGAIQVIDTAYSEKGREMSVYAPADKPLVIFAGREEDTSSLRAALSSLIGGLGVLALASLAVQELFGDGVAGWLGAPTADSAETGAAGGDGGAAADAVTETANATGESLDVSVYQGDAANATGTPAASPTASGATPTPQPEAATPAPTAAPTPEPTVAADAARTTTEVAYAGGDAVTDAATHVAKAAGPAAGLPPGLLFFAGGATALVVAVGLWYVSR